MTTTTSATQLVQSEFRDLALEYADSHDRGAKAARYCFASVNQRMITLKGESFLGSFSFFARGPGTFF